MDEDNDELLLIEDRVHENWTIRQSVAFKGMIGLLIFVLYG